MMHLIPTAAAASTTHGRGICAARELPQRTATPRVAAKARGFPVERRGLVRGPLKTRRGHVMTCNASAEFQPPAPSPDLTADQVVKAQLNALREKDSKALLKFATEEARTNGVFENRVQSSCSFRMLHGHIRSEVIGAIQKEPSQYEIWVRVWGMEVLDLTRVPATSTAVFIWRLSRDLLMEDASPSHGNGGTGCWLTHQIQREEAERDPRLRWAGI